MSNRSIGDKSSNSQINNFQIRYQSIFILDRNSGQNYVEVPERIAPQPKQKKKKVKNKLKDQVVKQSQEKQIINKNKNFSHNPYKQQNYNKSNDQYKGNNDTFQIMNGQFDSLRMVDQQYQNIIKKQQQAKPCQITKQKKQRLAAPQLDQKAQPFIIEPTQKKSVQLENNGGCHSCQLAHSLLNQRITKIQQLIGTQGTTVLKKTKKIRRKAAEITRQAHCPAPFCQRAYGTYSSLSSHIRGKHKKDQQQLMNIIAPFIKRLKLRKKGLPESQEQEQESIKTQKINKKKVQDQQEMHAQPYIQQLQQQKINIYENDQSEMYDQFYGNQKIPEKKK